MTKTIPVLDVNVIRKEFPILATEVRGQTLAYLDNAATSQKPLLVINTLDRYWQEQNANVHRGVHYLSQIATQEFDAARVKVQTLLNAISSREVIFTRGCTESVNMVATCLTSSAPNKATNGPRTAPLIGEGDEILISEMEHHSNIVPWQMAAERVGAIVRVIPITDSGEIDLAAYRALLTPRTKMVAIVHVSNSLGTVNPVKQMIALAHEVGALALVDGAQAGPHLAIDVQDIDADFYTLSCHKIYAPMGVGVLYGKRALLEALPPYHGGGDMIRTVSFERTSYAELPAKYEAGTPNVAGVIGLGAAIDYLIGLGRRFGSPDSENAPGQWDSAAAGLSDVGTKHPTATGLTGVGTKHPAATGLAGVGTKHPMATGLADVGTKHPTATGLALLEDRAALVAAFGLIHAREAKLASEATERLLRIPGVRVFGTAPDKAGIVSFTMDCAHPHDIGTILDGQGIAIRAGHHCCMPLMGRLGVPATARASFAFYNNEDEVDRLDAGVRKIVEMFA